VCVVAPSLSMAAVKRLFGDRIISRNANIAWLPRSPDPSVCAYCLWRHLKSVVYQTRPTNLAQLKTQIAENITNIPENTLCHAMQNIQNRLTECVQRNGQHLTDVIFKVVRVLGYRSGGPGSIPYTTRKKTCSGSGTGCTQLREYTLRS
jgi:hypothetical protein